MIYGYARYSTDETKQDINRQVRELKAQGATEETIYLGRILKIFYLRPTTSIPM